MSTLSSNEVMYHNKNFDYRLSFVMRIVDISASELARQSMITPATISRFCAGKAQPSYRSMVRLCRTLGCDSNFLLGLSDVLRFRK